MTSYNKHIFLYATLALKFKYIYLQMSEANTLSFSLRCMKGENCTPSVPCTLLHSKPVHFLSTLLFSSKAKKFQKKQKKKNKKKEGKKKR